MLMFGAETEYAVTGLTGNGGNVGRAMLVRQLLEAAWLRLRHLPDRQGIGLFLENGARFYIDCGLHPEMSTPECTTPWEVVRYMLAGDRILVDLARQLEARLGDHSRVTVFKGNVDYSGTHSTWGAHESYCHRAPVECLPDALIPHLVSRIVYAGAGGFNPFSPGLEFTLSPRAHHLTRVISDNSTKHRGIFHTKDEPLSSSGYHRLHILCGDGLLSETALWLKFGTTALVVAMIEAGVFTRNKIALRSPLRALKTFSGDPTCRVAVRLSSGRLSTALQIQHHYLALAEAHLHHAFMPDWAEEACGRWRSVLESLDKRPVEVAATLDWTIKWALYEDRAERRGFSWTALAGWSFVLRELRAALDRAKSRDLQIGVDVVRSEDSPIRREVRALTPFLDARKLSWDDLGAFLALRQEFFEIDSRFGQLGEEGIFSALDSAGKLTHRLPGIDRIEEAASEPPLNGRARLRGEEIRRLAGTVGRHHCDWQGIWDHTSMRLLNLSDPFEVDTKWQAIPEQPEGPADLRAHLRTFEEQLNARDRESTF